MIRLGISVEGATEREFVNGVLRQHLMDHNVHATAIDMRGNVSLDKIRQNLPPLLGSFERVSTFYDFYGFKNRTATAPEQLEQAIAQLVNPDNLHRFIPYVQCYEFEALLFAVPEQTVSWLQGSTQSLQQMRDVVRVTRAGKRQPANQPIAPVKRFIQ